MRGSVLFSGSGDFRSACRILRSPIVATHQSAFQERLQAVESLFVVFSDDTGFRRLSATLSSLALPLPCRRKNRFICQATSRPSSEVLTMGMQQPLPPNDCRWASGQLVTGNTFGRRFPAGALDCLSMIWRSRAMPVAYNEAFPLLEMERAG